MIEVTRRKMCSIVDVQHGSVVKKLQCAPGMEIEELRRVLSSLFVESRRIVGLESPEGACSHLRLLCASPSAFCGGTAHHSLLVLTDGNDGDMSESEFHLRELDFREVCAIFWSEANDSSKLDRTSFERAVETVVSGLNENKSRALRVLRRVWTAFEADRCDGMVEVSSMLVGMSALCAGETDLKLSENFALFDTDGDGIISLAEMEEYFAAVFTVYREQSPARYERLWRKHIGNETGPSIHKLAKATAEHCFQHADRNRDGVVSLDEFCEWYYAKRKTVDNIPKGQKNALGVEDTSSIFRRLLGERAMTRSQFAGVVVEGIERPPADDAERAQRLDVATALFDRLAAKSIQGSSVATTDLAAALVAVVDPVSDAALDLYVDDTTGGITKGALMRYMWAQGSDEELALACFRDHGESRAISKATFLKWCLRQDRLALFRGATCLDAFDIAQLASIFEHTLRIRRRSPTNMSLNDFRGCLLAVRAHFAQSHALAADTESFDPEAEHLVAAVFDAIAVAQDTPLSASDALLGLCGLCKQSDASARVVFELISHDGISATPAAFESFLAKYFGSLCALERTQGDPSLLKTLAAKNVSLRATRRDCLTIKDVEDFFAQPMPSKLQTAAHTANLRQVDATRVMTAIAACADPDGYVDKPRFVNSLTSIIQVQPNSRQALACADVFDVLKSKTAIQRIPAERLHPVPE